MRETAVIQARTDQTRAVRDELVGARNDLSSTKQKKLQDLSTLTASERAEASEIDALQAASARIAAQIRAAQARNTGPTQTPSNAGLIWPVQGPVTSPFGWRWGRMHEGIDIGVGYGTPIHAAAGGTVIYCGWEEGYGNFVVIDHGGNLATALRAPELDRGHVRPAGEPGPGDRLRRLHRPLLRAAPALRGAGQRQPRRPARLP